MDIIIWTRSVKRGDKTVPLATTNAPQRWNVYDVNGQLFLKGAVNPFFEAARHLIAAGMPEDDVLWLVRPGDKTTEHWYLRARLGYAAKLTVADRLLRGPPVVERFSAQHGQELAG